MSMDEFSRRLLKIEVNNLISDIATGIVSGEKGVKAIDSVVENLLTHGADTVENPYFAYFFCETMPEIVPAGTAIPAGQHKFRYLIVNGHNLSGTILYQLVKNNHSRPNRALSGLVDGISSSLVVQTQEILLPDVDDFVEFKIVGTARGEGIQSASIDALWRVSAGPIVTAPDTL